MFCCSHICSGFIGKVSRLTHLQLNQGVRITHFWNKESKTLSMALILSPQTLVNTPKLNASFDKADAMPSSVSSEFLCLVSNNSDNSRLKPATKIKYYNLWFQARTLLLPVPQAGKMSASMLILHFHNHPVEFGLWAFYHLITSF